MFMQAVKGTRLYMVKDQTLLISGSKEERAHSPAHQKVSKIIYTIEVEMADIVGR